MTGMAPSGPQRDRPDRSRRPDAEPEAERTAPAGPAAAPATGAPDSPAGAPPQDRPPSNADPAAPAEASRREPTPPTAPARPEPGLPQHQIRRTRTGGLWVAVIGAVVVLLLLLIFILQNSQQVQVSFFGADGHLPLGVAMSLSAVAGALLVALLGTARIVQLRVVARRHRNVDATVRR